MKTGSTGHLFEKLEEKWGMARGDMKSRKGLIFFKWKILEHLCTLMLKDLGERNSLAKQVDSASRRIRMEAAYKGVADVHAH